MKIDRMTQIAIAGIIPALPVIYAHFANVFFESDLRFKHISGWLCVAMGIMAWSVCASQLSEYYRKNKPKRKPQQ